MRASRAWLSLPLLLLSLSAQAEEPALLRPETSEPARRLLSSNPIRLERDRSFDALSATRDWRRVRVRKGAGFEYRRPVNGGEREVVFGVMGPLMKKERLESVTPRSASYSPVASRMRLNPPRMKSVSLVNQPACLNS